MRTDWVDNNEAYENVVLDYARHLLSQENEAFLQVFSDGLEPFIRAGLVNSLTQAVIKFAAPGVPDIYQGSETLNFSLVDPDNLRDPISPCWSTCLQEMRCRISTQNRTGLTEK